MNTPNDKPGSREGLEQLLLNVLRLAPHERRAFLAKSYAERPGFRRLVESLLVTTPDPCRDWRQVAATPTEDEPSIESDNTVTVPPAQRGKGGAKSSKFWTVPREAYTIHSEVAEGGMGRILSAWDRRLNRPVAIKELLRSTGDLPRRFEREARIAARLQHPSTISVYEAGRWPDGRPFYVMRMIAGDPLSEVIPRRRTLNDRLALLPTMIDIAEAVAYAHSLGIVHRDLKPANVIVGPFGETVLIDWGLAKDLTETAETEDDETSVNPEASPRLTLAGTVLGTPAYMPPEQAGGRPVDATGDVYSLGAILYHILVGTPPYQGRTSVEVLTKVLHGPPVPLPKRQPGIPPDLTSIIQKAMAREPTERYPSARELARDLNRFHAGKLVASHRYTPRQLLIRWMRRCRSILVILLVGLLLLFGTLVTAFVRIARERDLAKAASAEARTARSSAERRTLEVQRLLYSTQMTLASEAWHEGDIPRTLDLLKRQEPKEAALDLRGFEWYCLWNMSHGADASIAASGDVYDVAISPDGTLLAARDSAAIELWAFPSGRPLHRWVAPQLDSDTGGLAFSPNGRHLAAGSGQLVRILDVESGALILSLPEPNTHVWSLAYRPDGDALLIGCRDGSLRLRDTRSATRMFTLYGHGAAVIDVAVAPDGKRAASVGADGYLRLWNLSRRCEDRAIDVHGGWVQSVAFGLAGAFVVTGDNDGQVNVYDSASGNILQSIRTGESFCFDVAVSPDSRLIASSSSSGVIKLWDILTRHELLTIKAHPEIVWGVTFSPDGRWLVSASEDDTIKLWSVRKQIHRLVPTGGPVGAYSCALSPDGRLMAVGVAGEGIRVTPTNTGEGSLRLPVEQAQIGSLCFTEAGDCLALGTVDGDLSVVRLADDQATRRFAGHRGGILSLAFWPDGSKLASGGSDETQTSTGGDRTVRIWDVSSGREIAILTRHLRAVSALAISPTGQFLVSGDWAGQIHVWDGNTYEHLMSLPGHTDAVWSLAFSKDGRTLASSGGDGRLLLWHIPSPTPFARLHHHSLCLAFSNDGHRLASGARDRTVRLWDVDGGTQVARFYSRYVVERLAFSGDGKALVASNRGGSLERWSATLVPASHPPASPAPTKPRPAATNPGHSFPGSSPASISSYSRPMLPSQGFRPSPPSDSP